MPCADHAKHLRVPTGKILDRDSRGCRRPKRSEQIAANHRTAPAGISVKQEDGRLVVRQPLLNIVRPETTGFKTKSQTVAVEPRFETIERVRMADCLANDRKL